MVEEHRNEVLHKSTQSATINTMNTESPGRDGDKEQARYRTRVDLRRGRIPSPDALPCKDCGDEWSEGKPRRQRALGAEGVRGAKLGTKHPGAVAIRRVDGSVARFAAKNRLHATTVRSWYAKGEAAREIPRKWANALAKPPYSIPVTAWRNGIDP